MGGPGRIQGGRGGGVKVQFVDLVATICIIYRLYAQRHPLVVEGYTTLDWYSVFTLSRI